MPIEHLDDFNEALAIIEHRSDAQIERRHLEAAIEMVEAREAQIFVLKRLLQETAATMQPGALKNRIENALATSHLQA